MIGSSLGQHRWPSSRRTLEGSAAVFLSSLLALVVCASFATSKGSSTSGEWDGGDWSWWKYCAGVAWPVALASLAEAFTSQVKEAYHGGIVLFVIFFMLFTKCES